MVDAAVAATADAAAADAAAIDFLDLVLFAAARASFFLRQSGVVDLRTVVASPVV